MVLIDEQDFLTKCPDTNLDTFGKMNKELKDTYLAIYMKYSELFNKYLYHKMGLDEFDNRIGNSNLSFLPVGENEMDLYQYLSHDISRFFYIRNNYYIERLSNDEQAFLAEKVLKSESDLDKETIAFLESTYRKVIYENVADNENIYNINFGPNSESFFAPNNSLVLGFRYDEFNTQGKTDEQWDDNYNKQLEYINNIMNEAEDKLSKKLGIPVVIIKYDQFSIKKRIIYRHKNFS